MNAARASHGTQEYLITVDLSNVQLTRPLTTAKFKITDSTTVDQLMGQIFTRTGILTTQQKLTVSEKSNLGNRTSLEASDVTLDGSTRVSWYFKTLRLDAAANKDPTYPILDLSKLG